MIRFIVGLAIGLNFCMNAQAGVIASYNFNTNLSPSFSEQGVGFIAGAFTPSSLPGTVVRNPMGASEIQVPQCLALRAIEVVS